MVFATHGTKIMYILPSSKYFRRSVGTPQTPTAPHDTPLHPMAPHGTKIYVYLPARKSFRWVIIGIKPHGIKIYVIIFTCRNCVSAHK